MDPDPGGPNTHGSGCGSGSATLDQTFLCAPEEYQQINSRRVLYSQNTYTVYYIPRVSVPSSVLGLPTPYPASEWAPPETKGGKGTHSPAGEGAAGPIRTTGEKAYYSVYSVTTLFMPYADHLRLRCFH
jgi:hypothetical protein